MSVWVRGTVKRLKWRSVFSKTWYSAAALHHCALSLVTPVPLWGPLGGPLSQLPCYRRWIAWGMCQEALDLERSNGGERTESKCRKDEDHDLWYRPGPPADFRQVSMCCLLHWSGQQQHLLQQLQALGAQEMQWAQVLGKGPWLQMNTMPGNCTPLRSRPQREVQVGSDKLEGIASFCYLGDMLSAVNGCELLTTTSVKTACKKFKKLLPVLSSCHLSFKTHGYVHSSCVQSAMLHANKTWPLTKPNLQPLQQNDRAMIRQICNVKPQGIVTTRSNELLARLGIWGSGTFWRREGSVGMGMWNAPVVQSRQLFDIQVDAKHGIERLEITWQQLKEGLQRVEALGYQPSW